MKESMLEVRGQDGDSVSVPLTAVHTLVIGSGAAGLNAAVQLRGNGVEDVLIVTEGLEMGTSINTGSDKQTYYKLAMCGDEEDSPVTMARTFFDGGSMHGDLALVEASLSARGFLNLVNAGVPFPRDAYGQFVGYKTDHDPRQRATSIGPYTSREMCRALIRQVKQLGIPVREQTNVVRLVTCPEPGAEAGKQRVVGVLAVDGNGDMTAIAAANVIFAVGGPGGLYKTSVYPDVHTGAIGLALMAGAKAQGLPESQYGLASIAFRWNVSGTYMQVIPRFISTDADGVSHEREFMRDYFGTVGEMNSRVFLKGYQWPFDSRKVLGGSSIVDILVYIETVEKGRRVFLDFRRNPADYKAEDLSEEALAYLTRSEALQATPIERLRKMNPGAIALYADHGIDISMAPLEVAVCAQHNNGGVAGNLWWESVNVTHLFPVGEVNGSHGVYRPGGSALNSGQVGSCRAAEFVANRYRDTAIPVEALKEQAAGLVPRTLAWLRTCRSAAASWQQERDELQARMSRSGAHIRSLPDVRRAASEAWSQVDRIEAAGCRFDAPGEAAECLRNRHLCFAQAVYLSAVQFALESGVGSRGSAIVLDEKGERVHGKLDEKWRIAPEAERFRDQVLETRVEAENVVHSEWVPCRPLPVVDAWFETAWAEFREGAIYGDIS